MKHIKLTKGQITLVDKEDYTYLNQKKWSINGNGYAQTSFRKDGRTVTQTM